MSRQIPVLLLFAAALTAGPGLPQNPAAVPAALAGHTSAKSLPGNVASSAGLQRTDGELWGVGDRYKVRFSTAGFELTPALGAGASRNMPLRWRLQSIGRDAATPLPQDAVAPTSDGLCAVYLRAGVRETYDVRPVGSSRASCSTRCRRAMATWSFAVASTPSWPWPPTGTVCASS